MNILQKASNYVKTSQVELKKVVWPTKKEIVHHTMLVIGISLGMAVFLGGLDYIFTFIFGKII